MAARRMFSRDILESDNFINMSFEAQCLYVQLSISADDCGFNGSPRRVCRTISVGEECIDELIRSGFIHRFDNGVIVILDWCRCNTIQADRYKPTIYVEEFDLLELDQTKRYIVMET